MPSPFPGMDPYLEEYWGDVHTRLSLYASNQLKAGLPADLVARVEEYIAVEEFDPARFRVKPDVIITESPRTRLVTPQVNGGVAVAEPVEFYPLAEPEVLRSVRIIDVRRGNRVVTAIEFLSLSNKLGEAGKKAYREKVETLRQAGVNLVEIDLLRDGDYVLNPSLHLVPPSVRQTYRTITWRAAKGIYEGYSLSLRRRLPTIRIPLRDTDDDVALDLQRLVDDAYETGSYETIDYRRPLLLPLDKEDEAWADAMLREKGLR